MSDPRRLSAWLAVAAIIGLGSAGAVGVWHYRTVAGTSARMARLESENRDLRARSERMSREVEALSQGLPAAPPPQQSAVHHDRTKDAAPDMESARMLIAVRDKLAAANASIHALELRIRELEANLDRVTEENKRLAATESELKENLNSTNRVLEAVRTELKSKDDRLQQVMITNNQLLEENRKNAEKFAQMPRLVRDLEEVNRRRETYLTNLLRRYRDVNEQYRALTVRADPPGENAAAGVASADLARITNTITLAEEDLRQLSSLNAQAARLQQRIGGK